MNLATGQFGNAEVAFAFPGQKIPVDLRVEFELLRMFDHAPDVGWITRLERLLRNAAAKDRAPERKLQLPKAERGRGADEVRQIDRLRAKLARKDLKKEAREKAEAELQRLIDAPQRKSEEAWRESAAKETMHLASIRGESAQRVKSGAVHIPERDPLLALMRAGRFTAEQFDTALECRACYEARSEDVGSQMGSLGAGAPHNNDRFVHDRLQRAKKLQRLGTMERAVAVQCAQEPVALAMLRGVCGQNVSLSHYGEGRAYARNLAALIMALDVIAGLK